MNVLDPWPLWLLYALFVITALAAAEGGFRIGRRRQRHLSESGDSGIGAMVGATLGLLAFLLAFLTGIAAERFDNRRGMVVQDANAIGTAELRSRYLPEPFRQESGDLYREYVDIRIPGPNYDLAGATARSVEIQNRLWEQVLEMAPTQGGSELFSLYVDALNNVIATHGERVAAVRARLPEALLLLVVGIAFVAMFLVGYGDSSRTERSTIGLVVTTFIFGAVIALIVDLDRPQEGVLNVSQVPMQQLQQQLSGGAEPTP